MKLEEQLISFDIAKLAKEKGFDSINGWYSLYTEDNTLYACLSVPFSKSEMVTYLAPTQSLLQQWIEDNYSISINIIAHYSVNEFIGFTCHLVSWKFKSKDVTIGSYGRVEVLDNALKEALELI